MRREPLKFGLLLLLATGALFELFLLFSGYRILVSEEYFPAREASAGLSFYVPESEARFGCTYFTGRNSVFEDLSSYQYDECPFLWTKG